MRKLLATVIAFSLALPAVAAARLIGNHSQTLLLG
jgi:hypothetical protein